MVNQAKIQTASEGAREETRPRLRVRVFTICTHVYVCVQGVFYS